MSGDIEIRGLNVSFADRNRVTQAVADVNIRFEEGSITGLIGESGSGKSVLGMSILRLLPATAKVEGSCVYGGRDLFSLSEAQMRKVQGKEIALIPQNATESLNPVRTVGGQLTECVTIHQRREKKAALRRRDELLVRLGFHSPGRINSSYSFELSGGMNQRAVSALGLMNRPEWVIADEPTKGLDAVLRRQVYQVLKEAGKSEAGGMIVITHDIPLAGALCDRLAVLYRGRIVEQGRTGEILRQPAHPYTEGLMGALPENGMRPIPRPDPAKTASGCGFYPRCPYGAEMCRKNIPAETTLKDGRRVRCFRRGREVQDD